MPCILKTVHGSNYYSSKKVAFCVRSASNMPPQAATPPAPIIRRNEGGDSDNSTVMVVAIIMVVFAVVSFALVWGCVRRLHAKAYAKSEKKAHAVRRPGLCAYRDGQTRIEMPAYPPPAYAYAPRRSKVGEARNERWHPFQTIGEFAVSGGRRGKKSGSKRGRTLHASGRPEQVGSRPLGRQAVSTSHADDWVSSSAEGGPRGAPRASEYFEGR
ncbi:uncharacterized protein LTR77_002863 [Saxophila tyrrhenica]|uniref:Transmembrane protein n=1 Tax=Saxophila tyrrhenica TaxID=1690608 RepID=A0AAV9PK91_9PEZI|nr:hypothetical protein LTR77_002863 [Saxophila tyrrhenica]